MRRKFPPSGIRVGPSVCRQDGKFIWKRKYSHLRGEGGRPAPEPQGVQREVRAVPRIFPEEVYSDIPTYGRPHVGYVAERLCSPIGQLEKAVVRLQRT